MRVMLDTNILISAGLFAGKHTSSLTLRIADEHSFVLSSRIIDELRAVMEIKFPDKKPVLERFLRRLSYEMAYTPTEIDPDIYPKIRDKKDYPILASAIIADVDVFITGDKDFGGIDSERPGIGPPHQLAEPSEYESEPGPTRVNVIARGLDRFYLHLVDYLLHGVDPRVLSLTTEPEPFSPAARSSRWIDASLPRQPSGINVR